MQVRDVLPLEEDLPRGESHEPQHRVGQRGLPAAALAGDGHDPGRLRGHGQADVPQRGDRLAGLAVGLGRVLDLEEWPVHVIASRLLWIMHERDRAHSLRS